MILLSGITIGRRFLVLKNSRMRAATMSQLHFLQFLMQMWPFEDLIKKFASFRYSLGSVSGIGKITETEIFWIVNYYIAKIMTVFLKTFDRRDLHKYTYELVIARGSENNEI